MSPETVSSVFPDRLIHPLPKRRLRERLSPHAADSIQYPPALVTGAPLFYYPYNLKDDAAAAAERMLVAGRPNTATAPSPARLAAPVPSTTAPAASSSAAAPSGAAASQAARVPSRPQRVNGEHDALSASRPSRFANHPARPSQVLHVPSTEHQPKTIPSTASSVDGYESFENTNNKKKRKIPTVGDASHGGSYSSTDLHSATSGSSTTNSNDNSVGSGLWSTAYAGAANFASAAASGLSGPGRGRYGRNRSGRSPLHALSDAGSNWAGRYVKPRPFWPSQPEFDTEPLPGHNGGIISSAIANAEKQVVSPPGDENVRPATTHSRSSISATPASAQFTFTCSSQVPGNLLWSGTDPKPPPGSSYFPQSRARGAPGSVGLSLDDERRGSSTGSSAGGGSYRGAEGGRPKQHGGGKKKKRSKILQELEKQARDRRRAQQAQNAAHPSTGDIYVCPFCEYEFITGCKPRLIYAFEMKERKKRLEAERRQREQRSKDKAKNKNRKGRKASKTGAGANVRPDGLAADGQPYESPLDDPNEVLFEKDYYEDDDGAGEVNDFVAELRPGIGNVHNLRARGRDGEGIRPKLAGD